MLFWFTILKILMVFLSFFGKKKVLPKSSKTFFINIFVIEEPEKIYFSKFTSKVTKCYTSFILSIFLSRKGVATQHYPAKTWVATSCDSRWRAGSSRQGRCVSLTGHGLGRQSFFDSNRLTSSSGYSKNYLSVIVYLPALHDLQLVVPIPTRPYSVTLSQITSFNWI